MFEKIQPREILIGSDLHIEDMYAKIDFNTLIIFNKLQCKDYLFSVYLACKIAKTRITPTRIYTITKHIEKEPISLYKVKRALERLHKLRYLRLGKNQKYSITNSAKTNSIYKPLLKRNFYNKHFKIDIYSLKYFRLESREKNLHDFLFTNLIVNLWWHMPVTLFEIENVTGLKPRKVRRLQIESELFRLKYNDPRYSAFKNTKFNIVTTGKIYYQDYNPILTNENKYIDKRHYANLKNYFENRTVITTHDKLSRLKELSRLPINYNRRWFARAAIPYMSNIRQKFITALSENYLLGRIKNNTFVFQY